MGFECHFGTHSTQMIVGVAEGLRGLASVLTTLLLTGAPVQAAILFCTQLNVIGTRSVRRASGLVLVGKLEVIQIGVLGNGLGTHPSDRAGSCPSAWGSGFLTVVASTHVRSLEGFK